MKNLFKKAHKMTREMVKEYGADYQAQFGLCLSYLLEERGIEMVELKGTEKQVKWAEDIRSNMMEGLNEETKELLQQITDSTFFIDNRYAKGKDLENIIKDTVVRNEIGKEIISNVEGYKREIIISEIQYLEKSAKIIETTEDLYDEEREPVAEMVKAIKNELVKLEEVQEGNYENMKAVARKMKNQEIAELLFSEVLKMRY